MSGWQKLINILKNEYIIQLSIKSYNIIFMLPNIVYQCIIVLVKITIQSGLIEIIIRKDDNAR